MRALTAYNLLALFVCSGLGYAVYAQTQVPPPSLPESVRLAEVPTAEAAAPAPPTAFRMPPKNVFNQMAARPPFSQTRRPPRAKPAPKPVVEKPAPVAAKTVAEPQVTLVGIMIQPGKSIAMVRKPGAEELLRLAKGQDLDGWLVEGVLPDRLLLSHDGKILELELSEAARRSGSGAAGSRNPTARPRRQ